ncbi:type I-F CRISPR-associated endoribonuclease Cas6/Csy4 [Pseudothauera rhizosphaerae]|uniref:Type I-F CRISPR-associated endoribonuclease Cas6/Csy4 n=1 Tax=Pseudothauera rhizosphaerae TaxID=2565932 RepID=A0A4S4AJB1_9RHOO|nr:type I-F CRISPR-associated endoribonuclease Cas6/Csy4 [Pseudothauera rhizosphaerae]THF59400.1 type I-F CRISPR-associated endoribonuclease Cas6/Csy4 [Pseudothauera rhizosphaerae]
MDYYIDIKLLPDPEFPAPTLMSALFAKLHRGLVDYGGRDIGVSFPEVDQDRRTLGRRLRLHGTAESLERLMRIAWLQGMRDHIAVTTLAPVPEEVAHRIVRRVQAKSNPERIRRRLMARKHMGADEARATIPDCAAQRLDLPYVEIASRTTGQRFKLFIEHQALRQTAVRGPFGTYGLSAIATVPWF